MIARVFPRKTAYTPKGDGVYCESPGLFPPDEKIQEAFVSCSFSWDKPKAEQLADEWGRWMRVTLGGPAYDDPGGEFVPGAFIREGYIFTSRGCCNRCDFCLVPEREGHTRTLPIRDGTRVLDSNLLACPEDHIREVFAMLQRQKGKVGLHGGMDIRLLQDWHCDLLKELGSKLERTYIAYDSIGMQERVRRAIGDLRSRAGLNLSQLRCFVLVGYGDDSLSKAEERCKWVLSQGAVPFASYYRGPDDMAGKRPKEWNGLVSRWAWMPGIFARIKREEPYLYATINRKRELHADP